MSDRTPHDAGVGAAIEARHMVPSLRLIAPKILVAGVLPLVGYTLLRSHVSSDAVALAVVMVFPVAEIAFERVRHGRLEPVGIITLIGIVFGLVGALAFHGDATMLKLRESAITGLFGLVCLGSLLARLPAMFYLGRMFATDGDAAAVAQFNTIWDRPGAPRRFRRVTVVWGVALLGEMGLRTGLALTLSTGRFLAVAPLMGWVVIGALIWYSVRAIRAFERDDARTDPVAVA
ncbi:MAG: VC0807 family protein [Acidimicrobiales bacterium]